MLSISTQSASFLTCLVVLLAALVSCENSEGAGDADNSNTTDPTAGDTTDNDQDGDGRGGGDGTTTSNDEQDEEQEQEQEYCGLLDKSVDTSKEKYANQMCCLCADCEFTPQERMYTYIDSNQTTCVEIEFDAYGASPGTETCFELQREYRETCCNTECTPRQIEQEWAPVEPVFPQGDWPTCHLCKPVDAPNGQFPLKPYTITAVAYIPGNPTCMDLYWMGRTDNLPEALCYPLQNFMLEPCGCTPPDPAERPRGDEPWCDLCPGGQYPLRSGAFPNNIDSPINTSCNDLYWMGRTGNISAKLCEQVHQKAQDACGCLPEK